TFFLDCRAVLKAEGIEHVGEIGVANLVDYGRGGRGDHDEIVVAVTTHLNLVRFAQEVEKDLKAASKITRGVAYVAVSFENRRNDQILVIQYGLGISRLRSFPELLEVRL